MNTQPARRDLTPVSLTNRSRVSNGSDILPGVDGRSAPARRYRDILAAITTDQGGADRLTEARLQLVRRFSAVCVMAEQIEAKIANGEEVDIAEHALLSSTLVRLANHIGLARIPRNITPSLGEYLERPAAEDHAEQNG